MEYSAVAFNKLQTKGRWISTLAKAVLHTRLAYPFHLEKTPTEANYRLFIPPDISHGTQLARRDTNLKR